MKWLACLVHASCMQKCIQRDLHAVRTFAYMQYPPS